MFSRTHYYIFLSLISVFYSVFAQAQKISSTPSELTFAVVEAPQMHNSVKDSISTFYDINIDYLENILRSQGMTLNIATYPSIAELLDGVEAGEVDGAVGFSKTPLREQRFLFSEPFFESSVAAWYANPELKNRSIERLSWVCVNESVYCDYLVDVNLLSIVRVSSFEQAMNMVIEGRADAIASSYVSISRYIDTLDLVKGYLHVPGWLAPEQLRLITAKNNQELVERVNKILEWERKGLNIRSIASTNPYHQADRILQKMRSTQEGEVVFTYSASEDAYPFVYLDENGRADGFLVDFLALIQARTGLVFEYLEPKQILENNFSAFESDIVPVAYIDQPSRSDWLVTEPYLQTQFVSLDLRGAEDENGDKPSGILVNFRDQGTIFLGAWRHQSLSRYSNLQDVLNDLRQGHLRDAYIPADIAQSLVARGLGDEFVVGQEKPLKVSLALAINNHNEQLQQLMNAVFRTLDSKEIEKLSRGYRQFSVAYGYQQDQVTKIALIVASVLIVLLVLAYFIFHHLKLKVQFAEVNANAEEQEKQWLMRIIQELNSLIFIHNDEYELVMSNCHSYQSGTCASCAMKGQEDSLLVDNPDELSELLSGTKVLISGTHAIKGCAKQTRYVYRERKVIYSPTRDRSFVLTILHDITEQKQREQELLEAQRQAQAAAESRERFLATVSHELRTPIAAVQGLLELIERTENSNSVPKLLAQSRSSLTHLNRLVDEILDFSKLEADQLRVEATQVNLTSLLKESVRSFEGQAKKKQLEYWVDIQLEDNFWVSIDSTRLNQIVFNLLSNAVKFTHKGYIRVWCKVSNGALYLKIIDSGIGMTAEQKVQVLKPFVQADDSITRHFGGTGLGLSIVEKLVGLMGGHFSIETEASMGTTMSIELPVEILDSKHMSEITDIEASVSEQQPLMGKILVAEDNAINQNVIAMQLDNLGVEATIVGNGQLALECLEHSDFDIILTDFHMPELDGYGLAKAVKSDDRLQHIPVVGVTAEDSRLVGQSAMDAGIDEVLFKPYGIDALASLLTRYLCDSHIATETSLPDWLAAFDENQRLEVANIFINSMEDDMLVISGQSTDKSLKQAIHSLKGSSGAIGLKSINQLCAEYEKAEPKKKKLALNTILQSLEDEMKRVNQWVDSHE